MNTPNKILEYFGETHTPYLHARGKVGTLALIEALDCQPNEEVLEIGFGTAATLLELASVFTHTHFKGLEYSQLMYGKGASRLQFCFPKNQIQLSLSDRADRVPFEDNSFDKIYLESVLAIQEREALRRLLLEIRRVLRPLGTLIMNETIWLDSTPIEKILRINAQGKAAFGIIQANGSYPFPKDWLALLKELGFEVESTQAVDQISTVSQLNIPFRVRFRSFLFTSWGKLKGLFNRPLKKDWRTYQQKMATIIPPDEKLMEGLIIKAIHSKSST